MARVVPFAETRLADLWREVREQDSPDFWGDLRPESIRLVKQILEISLEEEMIYRLQAPRYARTPGRQGWPFRGRAGLQRALDTVYPYVDRQLCWVHKMRNVAQKLPRKIQKECLAGARDIYLANTEREARHRFQKWALTWRSMVPKAVKCIEKDLEPLLAFLRCPEEDWRKVRTTNAIERSFREARRRIRSKTL